MNYFPEQHVRFEAKQPFKSMKPKHMSKSANITAPDLTQRPPRSPRSRLGGYALLPRMLDKGRATIVGKNGEYNYDCPLDQHILKFAGIDSKKLLAELKQGKFLSLLWNYGHVLTDVSATREKADQFGTQSVSLRPEHAVRAN